MENSLGPSFQSATGYTYQGEGHGSLQDAQLMISGARSPDVLISASTSSLVLLENQPKPLVSWWLSFATDQLVIAYSNKSTFSRQLQSATLNQTGWYGVLTQPGFRLGITDPSLDPKGVYGILMFKLAAIYYGNNAIAAYLNSTHASTFAEETLPAELQSGAVDAMIAYRHEAIERGFSYITLPPQVNLGDPTQAKYYSQVSTYVGGKINVGGPIKFSVTIPTTVKNPAGALAFVEFILNSTDTRTLLRDHGFTLIVPPGVGGDASAVPRLDGSP